MIATSERGPRFFTNAAPRQREAASRPVVAEKPVVSTTTTPEEPQVQEDKKPAFLRFRGLRPEVNVSQLNELQQNVLENLLLIAATSGLGAVVINMLAQVR